ncbi:MAG: tetratricopeptide repeat protein [Bacteroidales bacterium]|nr:tetratricopeptide repeat protein [Bacteroidales bacterium]
MKRNIVLALGVFACLCLCLIYSCKDNKPADPKEERQQAITDYVEKIKEESLILDKKKADTLIEMYKQYVNDYPEDTVSEFYLFQMANVYANIGDCKKTIDCLNRLIQKYPNGSKVGAAYFFKGVFYKEICNNKEKSKAAFEQYIEKYPDNPHVEEAKRFMQLDSMENPSDALRK